MKLDDRTKSRQTTVWHSFGNVRKLNSIPMYYRGHWLSIHSKMLWVRHLFRQNQFVEYCNCPETPGNYLILCEF